MSEFTESQCTLWLVQLWNDDYMVSEEVRKVSFLLAAISVIIASANLINERKNKHKPGYAQLF